MGVILIAFERESEQSALEQLLCGRGHQVVRSSNGLTALDSARREPPHAIVSDIVLPRMDGFALCRKWKQDERLQSVPFLFYTRRHDDPKYERFALELGAERFLSRAAAPEALLSAIDEVLGGDQAAAGPVAARPPARDGAVAKRIAALESAQRSHAEALSRAQQGEADAVERARRAEAEAAELAQRAERAQAEAAEQARQAQAQAQALDRAQQAHAQALERAERAAAEAVERLRQDHAQALQHAQQMQADALERARREQAATQAEVATLRAANEELEGARRRLEAEGEQARAEAASTRATAQGAEFLAGMFRQFAQIDEAAVVRHALEQSAALTGSPVAYLFFIEPRAKLATLAGWYDASAPHASAPKVRVGAIGFESCPWQEIELLECVGTRHASSGDAAVAPWPAEGTPVLRGYLSVPLITGDEVPAVLGVARREGSYTRADERMLAGLIAGIWPLIAVKRMHAQTLRSLQRTDVALQGMIDAFVRVIERHDPYTAGSSRRLAALAVALGREAGLDGERQHALRVAALLHDVGNIAVPASILSKPAPLTETELALMRTHVEEGCRLLADIDFGAPVADIIYQSHERYDGSGYPRGLRGEEILLEARILAIADTVEAICSPRPYRPPAGMDAAMNEIDRAAGRLYDPVLVAACTRLVQELGFALPE